MPVEGRQGLPRLGVSGREDAVLGPAKEALGSLGDLLLAVESVRSSVPQGVESQSHVVRALEEPRARGMAPGTEGNGRGLCLGRLPSRIRSVEGNIRGM